MIMAVQEHSRKDRTIRTTVTFPRPLYEDARHLVDKSNTQANTLNEFFVMATCTYVNLWKRRQIDAQFAAMAEDLDYQKASKLIAEEFVESDWEALEAAEKARE